jgi:hypothetical protein
MRREQIDSALRAVPFKPFRLTLTTGDMHEVRHRELALLMRGTLIIGYPDPADAGADRFAIIDLSHIAQLDRADAPALPQNGDGGESREGGE